MSGLSARIPGLSEATVAEKLALIDELWDSVRNSAAIEIRRDHLRELEQREAAVEEAPASVLSPAEARALLKRRP
jgi:hypothetical protein